MSKKVFKDDDRDILERLYTAERMPLEDIATIYNTNKVTVRNTLLRFGIAVRGPSESQKRRYETQPHPARGVPKSEEAKAKMRGPRPSMLGANNPNYGKGLPGEQNPNWKGGRTAETNKDRNTAKDFAWKAQVFERDGGLCVLCRREGSDAHHILGWVEYPSERLNLDNGITLCRACHTRAENRHHEGHYRELFLNMRPQLRLLLQTT